MYDFVTAPPMGLYRPFWETLIKVHIRITGGEFNRRQLITEHLTSILFCSLSGFKAKLILLFKKAKREKLLLPLSWTIVNNACSGA